MAPQPDLVGTVTLTSGQLGFTVAGINMVAADVQPGDQILLPAKGLVLTIGARTSATAGTLAVNCPAAAAGSAQPCRIHFQSDLARVAAQTRNLIELIGSGNVEALAGLTLAANKGIHATGTGALATHDLTPFARTLLDDADAAAARTTIGASTVGNALFTAANQAGGRTALGLGSAATAAYEVGTFSPTLVGVTTPGTPDYVQNQGAFVKFGRLTLAHFYIVRTSMGGAAGTLRISGVPFAIASGAVRRPFLALSFWNGITLPAESTGIYGFGLTTDGFTLYRQSPSNSTSAVDASMVTGTVTIYASAVYEAAS